MSAKETRLYRIVIVAKPEGAEDPRWEPGDWPEICEAHGWWSSTDTYSNEDPPPFRWPQRLTYLTRWPAERRATLLREYGATVEVKESLPVEWP